MEISAQAIRGTEFKTVKKGYDPDEVDAFRDEVAEAVEAAQSQAAAMEARARAAVARLQEVSQQVAAAPREAAQRDTATPSGGVALAPVGDTEVISRTLLLAQRTADQTVADARAEAESVTTGARDEAGRVLDNARTMAAKVVEDARVEARRAKEDEFARAENEVQALLARRDFLLADVDSLEQYLQAQRERLREAALDLQDIVERVPGGLGDLRRPLMSASAEPVAARTPVAPAAEHAPVADPTPASALHVHALDLNDDDIGDDDADIDDDDDPMSLFASADHPAPRRAPRAGATDPWAVLDQDLPTGEVPLISSAPRVFEDVTAEVPVTRVASNDPFRIGGDELR